MFYTKRDYVAKIEGNGTRCGKQFYAQMYRGAEGRMTSARKLLSYNTATSRRIRRRRFVLPLYGFATLQPFCTASCYTVTYPALPSLRLRLGWGYRSLRPVFEGTLSTRATGNADPVYAKQAHQKKKSLFFALVLRFLTRSFFLWLLSFVEIKIIANKQPSESDGYRSQKDLPKDLPVERVRTQKEKKVNTKNTRPEKLFANFLQRTRDEFSFSFIHR